MAPQFPGGEITSVAPLGDATPMVQQTLPNGAVVWMGEVRSAEAALPAGSTDEVVFDFSANPSYGACGEPERALSFLIDDLRVE